MITGRFTFANRWSWPGRRLPELGAQVVALLFLRGGLVVHRVVHHDDPPLHLHRVRHVQRAAEHGGDGLGDHGLAVARVAEDEERLGGVHRGPERVEQVLVHDHAGEATPDLVPPQVHVLDGLPLHPLPVLVERHRRRAHVLAGVQRLAGPVAAGAGEVEDVAGAGVAVRAADLDHPPLLEVEQELVHQSGKGSFSDSAIAWPVRSPGRRAS
jgi:hypothetical protein